MGTSGASNVTQIYTLASILQRNGGFFGTEEVSWHTNGPEIEYNKDSVCVCVSNETRALISLIVD